MKLPHPFERFTAVLGGAVCAAMAVATWRSVSLSQSTWPFPALYFVELTVVGVLVAEAYLRPSVLRARTAWATAGVVAAFAILGAWTVGLLFLPAAAVIAVAAMTTDIRSQGSLGAHLGVFTAAALLQATLMVAMARMF